MYGNRKLTLFSLQFLAFLCILAAIYFILPKRYQWILLLVGSYAFYFLAGGWRASLYLISTTVTVFVGALFIQRIANRYVESKAEDKQDQKALKQRTQRKKRIILIIVLLFNLFLLGAVKYAGFIFAQLNALFAAAGSAARLSIPHLLLPLGISFYTFQSLGYLIDVYRGRVKADTNLFKLALFVSYFPQIVQGPISRYSQLAHQLYEPHSFDYDRFRSGAMRILWGFFRKLVIADRIAVIVNEVFTHYDTKGYTGFVVFLGVFLYGVQVYADFAGGMDIALGVSEILGITQIENFRQPYMAKSVAEFWRRWHITLGDWMREYVFYPLALSKLFNKMGKKLRKHFGTYVAKVVPTSIASLIVFFLVGLWHGASWNFIAYGLYQALFISTDSLFKKQYGQLRQFFHIKEEAFLWRLWQMVRTTIIITIGRYFSRASGFMHAWWMLKATFRTWNPKVLLDGTVFQLGLSKMNFCLMLLLILLLLIIDILQEREVAIRQYLMSHSIVLRWSVYFFALFGIIIFGMYGASFNARAFIYQGF